MTTHNRIIRPRDADHTRALLDEAMARRIAVTVAFWETRKDPDTGKPVTVYDEANDRHVPTYVRTLRTAEPFDSAQSAAGHWTYTYVDRCPKDRDTPGAPWTVPAVRRLRVDRVIELSFSSSGYTTPNPYFLKMVREHAEQQEGVRRWRVALSMTDTELWSLIVGAHTPQDAIQRVGAGLSVSSS